MRRIKGFHSKARKKIFSFSSTYEKKRICAGGQCRPKGLSGKWGCCGGGRGDTEKRWKALPALLPHTGWFLTHSNWPWSVPKKIPSSGRLSHIRQEVVWDIDWGSKTSTRKTYFGGSPRIARAYKHFLFRHVWYVFI